LRCNAHRVNLKAATVIALHSPNALLGNKASACAIGTQGSKREMDLPSDPSFSRKLKSGGNIQFERSKSAPDRVSGPSGFHGSMKRQ